MMVPMTATFMSPMQAGGRVPSEPGRFRSYARYVLGATRPIRRHAKRAAAAFCCVLVLAASACGSDEAQTEADVASCSLSFSELGAFGPDTSLGETMDESEALARMAQENIAEWVEVRAVGPWAQAWELATEELGDGIHVNLAWIDVTGSINGLFEPGDQFSFDELRVSRSFQGKLENSADPIYLPVLDDGRTINRDATCLIDSVLVGDPGNPALMDLTEQLPVADAAT